MIVAFGRGKEKLDESFLQKTHIGVLLRRSAVKSIVDAINTRGETVYSF